MSDEITSGRKSRFSIATAVIAAQVVSLVLLTSEIHAYFAIRNDAFTRELLVSISWAVYATVLVVIGLQRRYAALRYFAFALFGLTIVKLGEEAKVDLAAFTLEGSAASKYRQVIRRLEKDG